VPGQPDAAPREPSEQVIAVRGQAFDRPERRQQGAVRRGLVDLAVNQRNDQLVGIERLVWKILGRVVAKPG